MKYVKQYRVTDLFFGPSDNSHHILMVAADGEAWKVSVDRINDWPDVWRTGIVIDMSLVLVSEGPSSDRSLVPDWAVFGAEGERVTLSNPAEIVARHFSKETAARHFPSDAPVVPMQSHSVPQPAQPRKRRGSKAKLPPPTDRPESGESLNQ
jgi:hypothetical protein